MMLARGRNSWSMGDHKNRRSSGDLGNRLKINFLPVNCPLLLHLFFIDHKILPNIWYQSMYVTSKWYMSEHRISSWRILQAYLWLSMPFICNGSPKLKCSTRQLKMEISFIISIIKCIFGLKNICYSSFFMQQIDIRIIYSKVFVLNL